MLIYAFKQQDSFKLFLTLQSPGIINVSSVLTISNSAFCICGFRMILKINNGCLLNSINQMIICNGEMLCFISSTDRVLK
jgi:hypothetical protein